MIGIAFLLKVVFDLVNLQFPLWRLTGFRKLYLDSTIKQRWEDLRKRFPTIRVNIMVARRRLWLLGRKTFDFEYPLGFEAPNHHDMKLHLCWFQGVAGRAFMSEEPQVVLLPRNQPNPPTWWKSPKKWWRESYRLWPSQIKKTKNVRLIISVPMLEEAKPGEAEKARVRGVINIDFTDPMRTPRLTSGSDEAPSPVDSKSAEVMTAPILPTEGDFVEIIDYFLKTGKVASRLW